MARDGATAGWWQRNWGWCCGCGCLAVVLGIAAVVFGAGLFVQSMMESNEALTRALDILRTDPRAAEALGRPVKSKVLGENTSINFAGGTRLSAGFRVSGPEGSGRVELEARVERRGGPWELERLTLHVDGRDEPIDLLAPPRPDAPSDALEPADPEDPSTTPEPSPASAGTSR